MKKVLLLLVFAGLSACNAVHLSSSATPTPPTILETLPGVNLSTTPAYPINTPTVMDATKATPMQAMTASVSSFPNPKQYEWRRIADGLEAPVGLTHAGDGSGRVFIIEQKGVIRILQNNQLLPAPFLDIRHRVGSQGSEQGLLGLAFHPRYKENGFFFVNYTDKKGDTVIARFQRSQTSPDRADPESESVLLRIAQPYPNHNGGATVFGPDGYLYLGLGDGGSAGDPLGNGQSLQTLLGKILRLDVELGEPYAIPADNPFAEGGGLAEIWAYGLRNPWRFAFDRQTGDLYIGDVGQNKWEEIDFLPAGSQGGANFGWNFMEGLHPYQGNPAEGLMLIPPVAEYGHEAGCSVTGGVVYRGSALPEWNGIYLYGDYCSGFVRGLIRTADGSWQEMQLYDSVARIASFGEDEQGEVYLVSHGGQIYRLEKK